MFNINNSSYVSIYYNNIICNQLYNHKIKYQNYCSIYFLKIC